VPDDNAALAADAYIFGFPLIFNLTQVTRFTSEGMGSLPAAPFNEFSHATALASPEDTFVSINNDTIYSIAMLDLSGGPLRLDVPDTADRYYVLQFVDAWPHNFAYIGRRATGTAAGTYWIVPPGYGDPPQTDDPLPEFFLVANPIDRYSIGDRTPGLRYDDGGLTIVMQRDDPGGEASANWLPTPPGAFRPILRMYQPRPAVFDGSYELPPIIRLA
jgi:hypothetical protein